MTNRVRQLRQYLKKTCKIKEDLAVIQDQRRHPTYSTQTMAAACLLGTTLRTSSTRHLTRRLNKKGVRRFLGLPLSLKPPVEGTFRYFYPRINTNSLRHAFASSLVRMRKSKMHSAHQFKGLRVISIDGTKPFKTNHFNCDGCIEHERHRPNAEEHDPLIIWHDHRILTARLIGDSFSPWLGFHSQRMKEDGSGYEGELTAFPRLFEQLEEDFGSATFDVTIADALYATSGFIRESEARGWWATFVSKENSPSIQKEFEKRALPEPVRATKKVKEGQVTVTIWRHDGICLGSCPEYPLQVLKIYQVVETMEGRVIREDIRWIGSRIPVERLEQQDLWWLGWRRWETENGGHRTWKHKHHATHIFCHASNAAVENVFWLLMWGQNLLEAFGLRRLMSGRHGGLKGGLSELVEELVAGLYWNSREKLFTARGLRSCGGPGS